MNPVDPIYNYTIEKSGNESKFIYKMTPVSYRAAAPLCFYTFFAAILPASALANSVASFVSVFLVVMLGLSFGIVWLINLSKKTGEFTIMKTGVKIGDNIYDFEHISSFQIKDPHGKDVHETVIINQGGYYPYTMGGQVQALSNGLKGVSNEMGNALSRQLQKVRFKVAIRYGTKDVVIAKGLGENEAESLFEKVTEIAGYKA